MSSRATWNQSIALPRARVRDFKMASLRNGWLQKPKPPNKNPRRHCYDMPQGKNRNPNPHHSFNDFANCLMLVDDLKYLLMFCFNSKQISQYEECLCSKHELRTELWLESLKSEVVILSDFTGRKWWENHMEIIGRIICKCSAFCAQFRLWLYRNNKRKRSRELFCFNLNL